MTQTRMAPGTYTKKLLRIPPEILEKLEELAIRQHRSVNGQLVHILSECLEGHVREDDRHSPVTP